MAGLSISVSVKETGKNAPLWDLNMDLDGDASLKDFERHLQQNVVVISKQVLKEEQKKGFDNKPRVLVDRIDGKPVESVKPYGQVEYVARQEIVDVMLGVYRFIEARSPVTTGQYANSNYVFVKGKLVATNLTGLSNYLKTATLKDGSWVRFVNVTPYATRLEYAGYSKGTRGSVKGMTKQSKKRKVASSGKLLKKPNGTYALAFRAASRKYKKVVNNMRSGFMPNGWDGIKISGGGVFRNSYIAGNKNGYTGPYVYPHISFNITSKGTN